MIAEQQTSDIGPKVKNENGVEDEGKEDLQTDVTKQDCMKDASETGTSVKSNNRNPSTMEIQPKNKRDRMIVEQQTSDVETKVKNKNGVKDKEEDLQTDVTKQDCMKDASETGTAVRSDSGNPSTMEIQPKNEGDRMTVEQQMSDVETKVKNENGVKDKGEEDLQTDVTKLDCMKDASETGTAVKSNNGNPSAMDIERKDKVDTSHDTAANALNDDNDKMEEKEEEMDEDNWRDEFKAILDDIDRKGDFYVGRDVTANIPRFSPKIQIDGMDDCEHLVFPLIDYQAKRLRSFAEKAPFGKGMNTVLDESVRKAWQIDAGKVKFLDSDRWKTALGRIVLDCAASLGMTTSQQTKVQANLYKLLLYESGGHFKKHRDTEKEPGMFGTLIIQLPSKFTGGALRIEHASERHTLDYSEKSHEAFYASAFYADCEHELLPVQGGWRLCLAYNLVMSRRDDASPMQQQLPSAWTLTAQTQQLRKLARHWGSLFQHSHGYLLEHDYTETSLHFRSLKGRDKEVADLLRGCRDTDGNPLFVVCLMLISKHDIGSPDSYGYGYGYDDPSDQVMGEVHDTDIEVKHWIGPDDECMSNFRLSFEFEEHLLTGEDRDELFEGRDPADQEYESYTGNAGPTLEYWYYRGAVVFWPRSMNMEIMKTSGISYMLSYLKGATPVETLTICNHIVGQLEGKKMLISASILRGVNSSNNDKLLARALKSCNYLPNNAFVGELARTCASKSDKIATEVLELVQKTINRTAAPHSYSNEQPLSVALEFLKAIEAKVPTPFVNSVKKCIASEALKSKNAENSMKSTSVNDLAQISFEIGGDTFQSFTNMAKLHPTKLPSVLKCLVALGDRAINNAQVIDLATIRAKKLHAITKKGFPSFSWEQPNANFAGSQSAKMNDFLRGSSQTMTIHNFNGIGHARNWASKYFGYKSGSGYSASATSGGRGSSAYVTVTKTKGEYERMAKEHNLLKQELTLLKKYFNGNINVGIENDGQNRRRQASDIGPPPKKAREVEVIIIDGQNQRRQAPDAGPPPKKAREVEVIVID